MKSLDAGERFVGGAISVKPVGAGRDLPSLFAFAIIFTAVFASHIWLLRLPYYWDEAGYYIPAARDFWLLHRAIPVSTLTNAHPPLLSAYLALWWKFSGYTAAVTRIAMLLIASLALQGVYRLARAVANPDVALASLLCTAAYPVWFAQSSLAHADLPAAAILIWAMAFYFESGQFTASETPAGTNRWVSVLLFSIAVLAKETSVVTPAALAIWEAFGGAESRRRAWHVLAPVLPLTVWLGYFRLETGSFFGNQDYLRYNVPGLNFTRVMVALMTRLWHLLGHMNMFVLTGAMLAAMALRPRPLPGGSERPRIALPAQTAFLVILIVNWVFYSLVGGALLTRYLLPVFPLVIIVSVSTLWRRVPAWGWVVAFVVMCFVAGWFINPPYRFAPEDNLAYRDYILLHKNAAALVDSRYPYARVLTAWPASDELTKPFLGYVTEPLKVVRIESFSGDQLALAAQVPEEYSYALFFSTKYDPKLSSLTPNFWERAQQQYFDYHYDVPPEVAAAMLGGRLVWEQQRRGQWTAIAEFPRIENAGAGENSFLFASAPHGGPAQRPSAERY